MQYHGTRRSDLPMMNTPEQCEHLAVHSSGPITGGSPQSKGSPVISFFKDCRNPISTP